MDTLSLTVLLCYILCLVLGLTVVAATIVYKLRRPSSKGTRELKSEGGQREESAREKKIESRPVLKSPSRRGIHKRAVSSGEKPLKPVPAANAVPPEAQETGKTASSEGIKPWSRKRKMNGIPLPTSNKAGEQIEPSEVQKQVQPKNTAPVESSKPNVAPVNILTSPIAPQQQPARTEAPKQMQPKNTAPVEGSKPTVALKGASVSPTALPGVPRGQSAITEPKGVEKPPHEPPASNTSPTGEKNELSGTVEPAKTIIKKSEASMDAGIGTEVTQASSEPPAATADSDEPDQETPEAQKSGLGDLADLFATSASAFTEKNKLAEQVNEVDVNEILQEGLGLLGKVKKSDG